jgi:hypothetical protein
VIGLLRYAFLRGLRDSTLITLLVSPTVMVAAPAVVVWLTGRSIEMPPADATSALILFQAGLMGSLASFMAFRTEIATRAIGSFVLAARSWLIPVAGTIYGWIVGTIASTMCAASMFATGWGVPADLRSVMVNVVAITLAAAALGTMGVMISSSYSTVGWVYAGLVAMIGLVQADDAASGIEILAVLLAALISIGVAAVIVERRCAT